MGFYITFIVLAIVLTADLWLRDFFHIDFDDEGE